MQSVFWVYYLVVKQHTHTWTSPWREPGKWNTCSEKVESEDFFYLVQLFDWLGHSRFQYNSVDQNEVWSFVNPTINGFWHVGFTMVWCHEDGCQWSMSYTPFSEVSVPLVLLIPHVMQLFVCSFISVPGISTIDWDVLVSSVTCINNCMYKVYLWIDCRVLWIFSVHMSYFPKMGHIQLPLCTL